tara:strand:+ start:1807 stop:2862 length:1056 start_codon:yes stop_codon:yes gene_type:complete
MATVTKTVLKTYFEQGDIPTQAQYVDLIDSQFGLGEVGTTQIIEGTISASAARVEFLELKKLYIPSLGISDNVAITDRKGVKVGSTFTVGKTLEVVGDVNATGIISGSNISSTNITASGNIEAAKYHSIGRNLLRYKSNWSASIIGNQHEDTLITGSTIQLGGKLINGTSTVTNCHVTASGNISASGALTAATLIASTLDTGQGANQLYDMNQNVTNTSNVTFGNVTGNSIIATAGLTVNLGEIRDEEWLNEGSLTISKRKFSIKFSNLPTIRYQSFSDEYMTITNSQIDPAQSVVLVTNSTAFNAAGSQIGMHIANMYDGNFVIKLFHAKGGSTDDIPVGGISQFNFIIL